MNFNSQDIKSFFYKYWYLYYTLFFFLLGLLIYSISASPNWINANERIISINKRLDVCCDERNINRNNESNNIISDSIRVVDNQGEFGCLSFTLVWNSTDDLDLDIIDAKDNHIWYKQFCKRQDNQFSNTGGQLDIDMNARGIDSNQPVENIYFKCTPPNGNYIVRVIAFEKREQNPVDVKLTIREKGVIINEISSKVNNQNELIKLINYKYNAAE